MDLTCDGAVVREVPTPVGPGRLHVQSPGPGPVRGRLVLGHGAGGGVRSPDLDAAAQAGLACGLEVVRFEQPWRVAGRRVAVAPARLDEAWTAALDGLTHLPTVVGGRSAGARVACRTAARWPHVVGVLCLAFPLRPPNDRPSRLPELVAPTVPVLVVQGGRDAFDVPEPGPGREVVVVPGADHAFAVRHADGTSPTEVSAAVGAATRRWLGGLLTTVRR